MAQLVERVLGKDEVTGSNPVISSIKMPGRVFFCFPLVFFCSAFSLKQNALTYPLTTHIHDLN